MVTAIRLKKLGMGSACLILALGLLAGAAWCVPPEEAARAIYKATGVQGGLVVHLECGDGRLTAALRAGESYLAQGLETDAAKVEAARRAIQKLGAYGPVSIARWDGARLPYADNLVNLIVATQPLAAPRAELMRALAPGGVAYLVKEDGTWEKTVKARPGQIDEWTHYLHDAGNNAVAHDTVVGPPRHLQWVAGPRWTRSHDYLNSLSAAVSAGGRLFYIMDEAPTASVGLPPRWRLVARDAFSGVLLWKQPIDPWQYHLRGFRAGPAELARRLVAIGDRVYVTLGAGKPISALDGASGRVLRGYPQTGNALEFVCEAGVLFVVAGDATLDPAEEERLAKQTSAKWNFWPVYEVKAPKKRLLAVRADSGEVLWSKAGAEMEAILPATLAVATGGTYAENPREILCWDAAGGRELWRASRPVATKRVTWSSPTLVAVGDVVISADRAPEAAAETGGAAWTVNSAGGQSPPGEMIAFAARTGERLWSSPCREGYNSAVDVLVAGGSVWSGELVRASDPGITRALDPATGKITLERPPDQELYQIGMGHHRCYRNKATDRYVITGRAGAEFIDVATGKAVPNHWVRGTCQYGIIPCNGLLYAPPHSCACFIQAKTNGFTALAATMAQDASAPAGPRLETGPAYAMTKDKGQRTKKEDWPTYRHDPARSGVASGAAPAELTRAWERKLGGKLTAPVVAGGKVFVAAVDAHTVYALDAAGGAEAWRYTAGGRIDSPPTVGDGLAVFGCADGWIYCLSAADGRLAWRFRAAPGDRAVVAYEQLESVWPVHGSVLVRDGVVHGAAGRSSYLDGGLVLVRLDLRTGRLLSETPLDSRDPQTGEQPKTTGRGAVMDGLLNDVLSSDGASLFMRHARFGLDGTPKADTAPHLHSAAGFLDDDWWHRTYWMVGEKMASGWGGWMNMGNTLPAGKLLVVNGSMVYGYGPERYANGSHFGLDGYGYRLFARALPTARPAAQPPVAARQRGKKAAARKVTANEPVARKRTAPNGVAQKKAADADAAPSPLAPRPSPLQDRWSQRGDTIVRAMVLAGETLFVAGPPEGAGPEQLTAALEGRTRGRLVSVSAADGRKIAELPLDAPPVFDGLIAARGGLYLSATDGSILCFSGKEGR